MAPNEKFQIERLNGPFQTIKHVLLEFFVETLKRDPPLYVPKLNDSLLSPQSFLQKKFAAIKRGKTTSTRGWESISPGNHKVKLRRRHRLDMDNSGNAQLVLALNWKLQLKKWTAHF